MKNFSPALELENFINLLNSIPYLEFAVLGLCLFFAYKKFAIHSYIVLLTIYFIKFDFSPVFWNVYFLVALILTISQFRKLLISAPIIFMIKKLGLLPKISQTEKIALTSGNTWIDGELFSGNPNFNWILSQKYPKLTKAEKRFLNNEVEEVCKMCVDYDVQIKKDLPKEVWKYLKDKKFFGMIIPKKFGGLEFSAYAHSCVVEKLASRSVPLAITVMVPNSLGPGELLLHYGTDKQKNYYLPRLSDGRDLPCFALTEPTAGSDATSIISEGILFKDKNEIKIRLNWNKRYITLGAYATLIGVAFQLRDPDNLLSKKEDLGITCALIPHKTKGVIQGRRHDPLATPFVNSPLNGENVVIGLDAVIGGKTGLGKGWKMLMECLSAGRGISLPSTSSGGSKLVAKTVSAYAAIRQQFGTSIGKFEGIEEVLARIASRTYSLDAMRRFTAGSVDAGIKPAVASAIAKYHSTEIFRKNINDGMDILGGAAIIRGRRNILANAYFSTPISITVEGANIITRSLIHFGQGAIMCHPHVYKEIEALENNDLTAFDKEFFAHVNHLVSNLVRSMVLSLTRGYLSKPFKNCLIGKYERKIAWCSATFAFLTDIALAKFGGNLKRKEKLNGRFGDVLSAMYMMSCVLKKYQESKNKDEEKIVVEYALKEHLKDAQNAIEGIYQNLFDGFLSKIIILPFLHFARLNAFSCPSNDKMSHKIAKDLITNSTLRKNLTDGIFVGKDKEDNLGRLENAFNIYENSLKSINRIKDAIRAKNLPKDKVENLVDLAHKKSIITKKEKDQLKKCFAAILDAIQVDEYSLKDYNKL